MMCTSKNPVVGFVPCELCGLPSPTHFPKGGPRQKTLYYNCPKHLNQASKGVHDYCLDNQVDTLEEFVAKHGHEPEALKLKELLSEKGLMPGQEKPQIEPEQAEPEESEVANTFDEQGNKVEPETRIDQKDPIKDDSAGLIILIVTVVVLGGLGVYMAMKKKKMRQSMVRENQPPQRPAESPETANTQQEPTKAANQESFLL